MTADRAERPRSFLVTATPPTTNGDLHLGHLSGPYLAADVFCRAQRMLGHTALYVTGGDDHQSYVVATARRLGVEPTDLAARCNRDIRETLHLADIAVDAFTTPDEPYRARVRDFFARLHRAGRLARRTWTFPYDPATGRHLLEGFAAGYCPACLAETCGAICETCGHPNEPATLLYQTPTGAGQAVTEPREADVLVLPLEDYRGRFEAFYARHRSTMRPHVLRFVDEMLARPLPDFPVSYPADWGIPVPVDGFPGQVLNVWAEMLPGLTHMAATARAGLAPARPAPDVWARDSGYELVQFLGYDNTFYFAFAHLGLGFAHGGLIEPAAIITNEFLHLEGAKFSTSRGHLVWARDLVTKHGADAVRFHLALANPEHQPADFSEADFLTTVDARLRRPLAALHTALAGYDRPAPPDPTTTEILGRYRDRMVRAYSMETFSLRQAAETTAHLLGLLAGRASTDPTLALHGLRALATWAAPLLPGLTRELQERYGTTGHGEVPAPW
ncbi:class I tRNA ligase family protein [Streptomyces bugieae]|uniref:Class I tRNA ligase family protein n=1 Tax=Streptomyces bugieae TaxID=3098223 RepID=A0ABU7NIR5_9ACTN|nr:class I tRNA ligase family protein [Streptomyces sp. DSM 41528]